MLSRAIVRHLCRPVTAGSAPLSLQRQVLRHWRGAASSPSQPIQHKRFPFNVLERMKLGVRPAPGSSEPKRKFPFSVMHRESYQSGRRPFYRKPLFYMPVTATVLYLLTCFDTVELTGRNRFLLLPDAAYSLLAKIIDQLLWEENKPKSLGPSTREHIMIQNIVRHLCHCNHLEDLSAKTFVVVDDEINAFCSGGGTIIVNTGLIKAMDYDANKIALVVGHEMGHFLAKHNAEQAGQQSLALLFSWLFGTNSSIAQMLWQLGLELPLSRKLEQEADFIGLMLCARSCVDLTNAIQVWLPIILAEAHAVGRDTSAKEIEEYIANSQTSEMFRSHPTWAVRLAAYKPDGPWMQLAHQVQMQACAGINKEHAPQVAHHVGLFHWFLSQSEFWLGHKKAEPPSPSSSGA